MGLSEMVVELNTEEFGTMLRSGVVPAAFHHMARYSLPSEEERSALLEL
jgi:hypothetical protein